MTMHKGFLNSVTKAALAGCLIAVTATTAFAGNISVDPKIPVYKKVSGVSGNLTASVPTP